MKWQKREAEVSASGKMTQVMLSQIPPAEAGGLIGPLKAVREKLRGWLPCSLVDGISPYGGGFLLEVINKQCKFVVYRRVCVKNWNGYIGYFFIP